MHKNGSEIDLEIGNASLFEYVCMCVPTHNMPQVQVTRSVSMALHQVSRIQ